MRTPGQGGRLLTIGLILAVLAVAGIQLANPHSYVSELVARIGESGSGPEASVTDLTSIDQLQARFNADDGHARLLLLFSPT
jgi:hypothetical protein